MSNNKKATGSFAFASTAVDFVEPPQTRIAPQTEEALYDTEHPNIAGALGTSEVRERNAEYIAAFEKITGEQPAEKCKSCEAFEVCGLLQILGI